MDISIVTCFTDASYSKEKGASVIAYKICNDIINIKIIYNMKNSEAEKYGVEFVYNLANNKYPNCLIKIYTDCKNIKYSQNNLEVCWIKGHTKSNERNNNDLIFRQVDQKARKVLRSLSCIN